MQMPSATPSPTPNRQMNMPMPSASPAASPVSMPMDQMPGMNMGSLLVMEDDSPVDGADDSASMPGHADYEMVRQMQGFAYYVVDQDGMPVLVANKRYKEVRSTDLGGLAVAV